MEAEDKPLVFEARPKLLVAAALDSVPRFAWKYLSELAVSTFSATGFLFGSRADCFNASNLEVVEVDAIKLLEPFSVLCRFRLAC